MPPGYAVIGLSLLLCLSGCGTGRSVRPAGSADAMRFVATAPPGGETPGRGSVNLVFVTRRRGFVATTGGRRFVARDGWALPSAPGEIERTHDGGSSWRTLWRGPLSFDALAVRRSVIVAAGLRLAQTGRVTNRGPLTAGRHVLMVSGDGGRTWRRRALPVRGRVALQIVGRRLWLAFRGRELGGGPQPALLRSTDGGRRWREVALPRGAQAVRFATRLTGVANAYAVSCRGRTSGPAGRRMQLWRTSDGGRTWTAAAGTCAQAASLADFDVVSRRLLFAVQSGAHGERGPSVLRRSSDGGASWTTVARDRRRVAAQVHFEDRRHGSLVEREPREDGYVVLCLLASTSDGGRTWKRHPMPARSGGESGADPLAALVGRDAWVGHDLSGVVWHTSDGGRSWRLATAPRYVDPGSDAWSRVMLSGRGLLIVASGAGPVQSRDDGRTWTPTRWPSARAAAIAEGRNAYVVAGLNDRQARLVTRTGSRRLRLPHGVGDPRDVAFTSPREGIVIAGDEFDPTAYATHDGGRTWTRVQAPRSRELEPSLELAPGLIVRFGERSSVSVTTDEGASWQSLEPPAHGRNFSFFCGASRPSAQDVWITCDDTDRTILFRSGDAGRTWTRRVSDRLLDVELRGTGGPEAWATSPDHPETRSSSTLWHTTDGGATWTQAWVSLSPRARARQIDCASSASGVVHDRTHACR